MRAGSALGQDPLTLHLKRLPLALAIGIIQRAMVGVYSLRGSSLVLLLLYGFALPTFGHAFSLR